MTTQRDDLIAVRAELLDKRRELTGHIMKINLRIKQLDAQIDPPPPIAELPAKKQRKRRSKKAQPTDG